MASHLSECQTFHLTVVRGLNGMPPDAMSVAGLVQSTSERNAARSLVNIDSILYTLHVYRERLDDAYRHSAQAIGEVRNQILEDIHLPVPESNVASYLQCFPTTHRKTREWKQNQSLVAVPWRCNNHSEYRDVLSVQRLTTSRLAATNSVRASSVEYYHLRRQPIHQIGQREQGKTYLPRIHIMDKLPLIKPCSRRRPTVLQI